MSEETLSAIYKELCRTLSESDALYMIQKRTPFSQTDLITSPDSLLLASTYASITEDMKRYKAGEPLSRIYKEREFWGLNFELSSETLDPRADTETLIEAVLQYFKTRPPPESILDLGTGSGCILIALLTEFPDAQGTGIDLSSQAVQTAARNARNYNQTHNLGDRAKFLHGSWGEALDGQTTKFDLVVSNPPYITQAALANLDQNVQDFDPILALDGGEDGVQAYKDIFLQLPRLLEGGAPAFFEIGFDQKKTLMRLSKESGFSLCSVHRDSADHPRVIELCIE